MSAIAPITVNLPEPYHHTAPTEIVGQWNSTIRGLAQVEPVALPEKPGNSPDIAALHWAYKRFK